MSSLINKGKRGNVRAMRALYEKGRGRLYSLCRLLTLDGGVAENACAYAFNNTWRLLLDGNFDDERSFFETVERKAVSYCKNKIAKTDGKAFRIPTDKNFIIKSFASPKETEELEVAQTVFLSLPVLHRFIYVLYYFADWSEEKIAELLHARGDVIRCAMGAEQTNVDRALEACGIGAKSLESRELWQTVCDGARMEKAEGVADSAVVAEIDSAVKPMLEKRRKKAIKVIGITFGTLGSICLVVLGAFGIAKLIESNREDTISGVNTDAVNTDAVYSDASYDDYYEEDYYDELDSVAWVQSVESPTHYATIDVENCGEITVALDANNAPATVENFISLAEDGFYDGLTFHRIVEGFVMQGGDPNADGSGGNIDADGNELNVAGEFYYNGYENPLSHVRGAISMARAEGYDSASSQFFIVQEDSVESLDGLYAAFGYVVEGMDVVDAICASAEPVDENGYIEESAQPVISSVRIYTPEEYGALEEGLET